MTHGRRHAPYLPVAALGDDELDPGRRNVLAKPYRRFARPQGRFRDGAHSGRACPAVVQRYTASQVFEHTLIRHAFYLRPVGLRQFVFWVGDPCLQGAVVGEQQQALAVIVEPPGGTHGRELDEIRERLSSGAVGKLAQHVERLVQQNQHHSSSVSSCA